ncbi:MAG: PspA/IM30 family protein [Myxococcales bacterium FL481]|nr:MAG: PspA/IM30 family protein [Myxococcales bacterium FL481]
MATEKTGLFSRLKRAISGTLNDAVDSLSDPGQELALMLDNLADQIKKAESDLRDAMVSRKVAERKVEELVVEENSWQDRAERALKLGDENLARSALERKSSFTTQRRDAEASVHEQSHIVDTMKAGIEESKAKLKSLNLRRGTLMAQARATKQNEDAGIAGSNPTSRIDDIEQKISEIEIHNELVAEESKERAEAAAVDAQLDALDEKSELDDELAALKAKLRGQNALTDGKS